MRSKACDYIPQVSCRQSSETPKIAYGDPVAAFREG